MTDAMQGLVLIISKNMVSVHITYAIHGMLLSEVHPKANSPAANITDPIIIGGRRASGTGLQPLASKRLM